MTEEPKLNLMGETHNQYVVRHLQMKKVAIKNTFALLYGKCDNWFKDDAALKLEVENLERRFKDAADHEARKQYEPED